MLFVFDVRQFAVGAVHPPVVRATVVLVIAIFSASELGAFVTTSVDECLDFIGAVARDQYRRARNIGRYPIVSLRYLACES